jgi:hypothetical protein
MLPEAGDEGISGMPEVPMRYHLLAPEVKCPACGEGLTFIRVRGQQGDLYACTSSGPCKCQVMHYRNKKTKTCGYSVLFSYGAFGLWTACEKPTAKE